MTFGGRPPGRGPGPIEYRPDPAAARGRGGADPLVWLRCAGVAGLLVAATLRSKALATLLLPFILL